MSCSILDTGYIKREMRQLMSCGNSLWKKNWTIIIIAQIDMWTINNIGESGIVKKKEKCLWIWEKSSQLKHVTQGMKECATPRREIEEQTANAKVPSWKARISSGNNSLSEHEEGNRRWRWEKVETVHPCEVIIQIPGIVFNRSWQPWRHTKIDPHLIIRQPNPKNLRWDPGTCIQSAHRVNLMLGKCRTCFEKYHLKASRWKAL